MPMTRLRILRQGDYPGLSRLANVIMRVHIRGRQDSQRERRSEDGSRVSRSQSWSQSRGETTALCRWLWRWGRASTQRFRVPLEAEKGRVTDCPLVPPEGTQPPHPFWASDLLTIDYKIIDVCYLSHIRKQIQCQGWCSDDE